jgi:hypothetical protein
MSICAWLWRGTPAAPRRPAIRRSSSSASSSLHWWLSVLYILVTSMVVVINSQYSSHCHFNQLCSCRVVPVKRGSLSSSSASNHYQPQRSPPPPTSTYDNGDNAYVTRDKSTPSSYTGQFGIIIPE